MARNPLVSGDFISGHTRIVMVSVAVVLLGIGILAAVQIAQSVTACKREAASSVGAALLRLQPFVAGTLNHVTGMRMRAEEVLASGSPDDPLWGAFVPVPGGRFALDQLPVGVGPTTTGNCTGLGDPAAFTPEQRRTVAAGLALNPLFRMAKANLPEAAWAYLTTPWCIHIHPWRPSKDYAFWTDSALLSQEFFTGAMPERNPGRTVFWTAAYVDGAGLGLMVTCAAPVYAPLSANPASAAPTDHARFVGSVALDVTLDGLNKLLSGIVGDGARLLLIDPGGQALAGPGLISSKDPVIHTLDQLVPAGTKLAMGDLAELPEGLAVTWDGSLVVRSSVPGTSWQLVLMEPINRVVMRAAGDVLPWLVLVLAIVIAALAAAAVLIRREFVQPAQALVTRISGLSGGDPAGDGASDVVPGTWRPWFAKVGDAFAAKRDLLEHLKQAKSSLEAQVAARTSELSAKSEELSQKNGELEQALDELKAVQSSLIEREKLASMGIMVAGLAHEINTPMGVAMTAASHLADAARRFAAACASGQLMRSQVERFVAESAESARLVESNLARAAQLVRSFKRVSADQARAERQDIDVAAYVREVLTSLAAMTAHHPHRFLVDSSGPVQATTWPGAIAQVVTSLVENALVHAFPADWTGDKRSSTWSSIDPAEPPSASSRPTGTVVFKIERRSDRVWITYRDNGVGMSEEVRSHIFEPFFTTRRGSGGTGLGLYVAYTVVTGTLGGAITCASRVGGGTTITINLPAEASISLTPAKPVPRIKGPSNADSSPKT